LSDSAEKTIMGRIRNFTVIKDWRTAAISFLALPLIIFQLAVIRNNQATASYVENNTREIDSVSSVEAAPQIITRIEDSYIQSGSTLSLHLENNGISSTDSSAVIDAVRDVINLRRLQAGQKVEIHYENNYFSGILIPVSIDKDVLVQRSDSSGFDVTEVYKDLQVYPASVNTVVDSSLYASCVDSGIPEKIIMDLIQLYSFDVDFQRDIQKGDQLHTVYEVVYDDQGVPVDTGNILYSTLKTGGQDISIYRFEDSQGRTDYFNRDGQTVRKTLLKTPINGAYITSNFGRRTSPITGYNSVHKGIDFGAPRGTPIKTSGDGVVVYAGYNEVYGNHVIIRHVNSYQTLYGHMTSFGRGIRKGIRVDQGQVIGYVGSTGMSTGPHLHYEVIYNGVKINPSNVKFPPGRTLDGSDRTLFFNMVDSYAASLP